MTSNMQSEQIDEEWRRSEARDVAAPGGKRERSVLLNDCAQNGIVETLIFFVWWFLVRRSIDP